MSIEVLAGADAAIATAADAVRLSPDAALIVDADGASAIADMNGAFYGISAIGAAMLRGAVVDGRAATIAAFAARYGVTPARIAADFDALITDLANRGVVQGAGGKAARVRPAARVGAGLCALLVRRAGNSRRRARLAIKLGRLSFALFGWRATVDAWRRRFPGPAQEIDFGVEQARAIDSLVRGVAARDLTGADCKERALACFALARAAGLPAVLHVGVALYPLGGHCWCRVGDVVVSDDAESCDRFLPVFRYA